jgi:hypothetical protein
LLVDWKVSARLQDLEVLLGMRLSSVGVCFAIFSLRGLLRSGLSSLVSRPWRVSSALLLPMREVGVVF